MLDKLVINGYRGIKDLELGKLGKINIIAGENNTGKTSILEVIESLERPNSLRTWRQIGRREGNNIRVSTNLYDTMKSIFPINNDGNETEISYSGIFNNNEFSIKLNEKISDEIISAFELRNIDGYIRMNADEYDVVSDSHEYESAVLDIEYIVDGQNCGKDKVYAIQKSFPKDNSKSVSIVDNVIYVSPTQHANNNFYLNSLVSDPQMYQEFVEIMKQFDPDFVSINLVEEEKSFSRKYVILSKKNKEGLLLNAYGDGMKKAILLLSAVIRAKGGILLLDEFETAIHVSIMGDVFKWIIETAVKLDVQIFMTSHSIEAISEVLKCCPNLQKDIRMITLVRAEDDIKVRNVDAVKAIQMMDEYGLELR